MVRLRQGRPAGPLIVVKLSIVAAIVVMSATVLWTNQTTDALLRTDTYLGAVGEVAFWAWPTFVVYLVVPRTMRLAIVEGGALALLFGWQWYSSASDRHSTAALGPAFTAWFCGPTVLVGISLIAAWVRSRRTA